MNIKWVDLWHKKVIHIQLGHIGSTVRRANFSIVVIETIRIELDVVIVALGRLSQSIIYLLPPMPATAFIACIMENN